jgi:hypothetical protein
MVARRFIVLKERSRAFGSLFNHLSIPPPKFETCFGWIGKMTHSQEQSTQSSRLSTTDRIPVPLVEEQGI